MGVRLHAASWRSRDLDAGVNVASTGPPILHWRLPLCTEGLVVDAWLGSSDEHRDGQDALLVVERDHEVVLAVADGVTPTHRTPVVDGTDGARFAARFLLERLLDTADAPLIEAFHEANELLIRQFASNGDSCLTPRDLPQTAAAAVAVRFTEDARAAGIEVARAADCDVWTRRRTGWYRETRTDMITPAARYVIDDWDRSNHAATHEQRVAEGEPLLDDPNSWNVTAVGRFETPKLERIAIPAGFDELVLVTDGIDVTQLLELGEAEPSEWVRRSRHIDAGRSPRKPHDDIAMLRLRRPPGDHAGTSYSKT